MLHKILVVRTHNNADKGKGKYKNHNSDKYPAGKIRIIPGCYGFSKKKRFV